MTATADKAVTAASETLIPASSRVSLLVGDRPAASGRGSAAQAGRADPRCDQPAAALDWC
jgi:hypothetical protein